ncbi:MAG: DUF4012 domain-containing protein [Propionibacteriales bacterium]|nr:DUF4012 domain-containing protein [Propionibacteriales bacterium]
MTKRRGRVIAAAVFVVALIGGGFGAWWANEVQTAARAGEAAARQGIELLKSGDGAGAQAQLTLAQQQFERTRSLLGPSWLQAVPLAGRQVQAIDQLAQVGAASSSAGAQMAALVAQTSTSGHKLNDVLKVAKPYLLSAVDSLGTIAAIEPQLSTDGLLPPVADAMRSAQELLAPTKPLLAKSGSVAAFVNYLFAGDHRFVLVSQNSAELRPTGGFMGSYGLVKAGKDGLSLEKYSDIYHLPAKSTLNIPRPPGARMAGGSLTFRDSNWWLDYPTSAETMLKLWDHLSPAQPSADGIVAIDLVTVQTLLREFGPIKVPEYSEPISADNMIPVLSTLIDDTYGLDHAHRKDILKSLSAELLNRMLNIAPAQVLPTAQLMMQLADQKHIQFYVRDAAAQQAILDLGWAGAMAIPSDATDLLGVANAVVWPSKMNFGVHKTIGYQVQLNPSGTADTVLTLGYQKDARQLLKIQRKWFGDYLRVYRPAGTTLTGSTSQRTMKPTKKMPKEVEIPASIAPAELNTTTIINGFSVMPGEKRTQTYNNTVPAAMVINGSTAHYRLLMVKQSDLEDSHVTVTINAPAGWTITSSSAAGRYSGTAIPFTATPTETQVTLDATLTTDLVLDLTLAKA